MNKKLVVVGDENSAVNLTLLCSKVYSVTKQNERLFAELSYVNEEEIKNLNNNFRGVNSVTDVLSFPTLDGVRGKVIKAEDFPLDVDDENGVFIGSIAVCVKRAEEQALEYGHSVTRELTYLICHGLLHLLGYDHLTDDDKTEMRKLEEEILNGIKVTR
jgi:probable rRNA maturation factor